MSQKIDIVFDGPPGEMPGRFVEVENTVTGKSISVGEWIKRDDGYWVLRLTVEDGLAHDPDCIVCKNHVLDPRDDDTSSGLKHD